MASEKTESRYLRGRFVGVRGHVGGRVGGWGERVDGGGRVDGE